MLGLKQPIYLLIFSGMLFCSFVNAQVNNSFPIDQRILEMYEMDYIERMHNQSPQRLTYLTYYLDHSYFITNLPPGKVYPSTDNVSDKNGTVGNLTIDCNDLTNFNVLKFNFKRKQKTRTFYQIGDSEQMIVFYSQDEFLKSYNNLQK